MANRKVQVDLLLNARNYLDEALRIDSATGKLDDSIADLGDSVDDTEFSMKELAKTSKKSSTELGAFGSATEATKKKIAELDQQLIEARKAQRDLAHEYSETNGDEAVGKRLDYQNRLIVNLHNERLELERATEAAEKFGVSLGGLTRVRRDLVQDSTKIGAEIGTNLAGGIGSGLTLGKKAMMPALIGLGVVASPFIAAAIAGAVVGGVGLGGIVGGIVAASGDPRVKAAWADFTDDLTGDTFGRQAFVDPVIEAIAILKAGLASLHLAEVLGQSASAVPKLATALIAFAQGVLPGVSAALGYADEYADIFGEGLADVGVEIGSLIKDFAESEGAMEGLRTTFSATADVIGFLSTTISFLSNRYHDLNTIAGPTGDVLAKMTFYIPPLSRYIQENADKTRGAASGYGALGTGARRATGELHQLTRGTETFGESASFAAMKTGELSTAWDILHGRLASSDEMLLRAKRAVDEVKQAFDENGRSIHGNSEAALENRVALSHAAETAAAAAQAYYKLTNDAGGANKIMEDQRVAAENASGATGKNKDAVHALATELFSLPPFVQTRVDVNIYQHVFTKYTTTGNASQINANLNLEDLLLGGRASGGPVGPGLWKVGEQGPEILEMGPGQQGYVHPNGSWQSPQPTGGWQSAGGGGGGSQRMQLTVTPAGGASSDLINAILDNLRFTVDRSFGGDAQAALSMRNRR